MISKKDILSMARKVTHRSQGVKERKSIDPRREWLIGVSLFIIIALTGGIMNARNYVYYNTLELTITDTTQPIKKYQRQSAEEALERYSARLSAFDALVDDVPIIVEVGTTTASTTEEVQIVATEEGEEEVVAETEVGDSAE